MSDPRANASKLSLSEKFVRLRTRLKDSEWRRYGKLLLAGKALGGFTMLEAGFCRSRETVNVLMECIVDTCLCGILFFAFGFSFMFSHGNGFIGYHWFFLQGAPATYETTGVAFLAFWLFQFAFADTCSTITSGAMIGRTGFVGDLLYSVAVSGFIYPIIGHWAWGPDGFLALMGSDGHFLPSLGTGFHDFAGSTVVHTIGGFIALAGAIVLGPRLGRKFKRDGGGPMLPHDLTIAATGGLICRFDCHGVCLHIRQKVGCQLHSQWLSSWIGRHHLPLLLGQPDRRHPPWWGCRRSCGRGCRAVGVASYR